tara:strand:+ start:88 stop:324 length:237 start_codon:yes stop_codon:yes gene_type:complete
MPTKREREYYRMGFQDGQDSINLATRQITEMPEVGRKPKRKLSAWNKYVKNKRNHITYRDGKLNLKKMAVAFRRKKRR